MRLAIIGCTLVAGVSFAEGYNNVREEIYVRPSRYQETITPHHSGRLPAGPTVANLWRGTYVGAHLITGEGDAKVEHGAPGTSSYKTRGTGLGVTAGRDWRRNNVVMGVAADIDYRNADGNGSTATRHDDVETRFGGAVRGRLGVVAGNTGKALLYVTGGLAATQAKLTTTNRFNGNSDKTDTTLWGPTYGVGMEYAMNPRTTARVELRHTDYHSKDIDAAGTFCCQDRKLSLDDTAVMVGLTRKLGY